MWSATPYTSFSIPTTPPIKHDTLSTTFNPCCPRHPRSLPGVRFLPKTYPLCPECYQVLDKCPLSLSHTRYYAREIETAGGRHLQLGGHPDDGGGSSGHRMARLFAGGARFEISPP